MLGLLDKARTLRKSLGAEAEDEFVFDPGSGISRDEQKEIRQEIERVASKSRMTVTPEMFAVKAAKRGVLFPIVVNAITLVVLVAGLALFYFLFQRGETQAAREDTATITAEGKLLQEVKKESEARLQEKNQQINQIQGQLEDLDKQRLDLQSNMDAKVQEKEGALRAAMAAELEAEKARLKKQGLSEEAIEKRLAALEEQKNAAFNKQLQAFKDEADAERRKSEATLRELQSQFNTDLAKANTERQQLVTESKQREAELQAQLTAKTKEMASAQAQTQAQLSALSSQKQQEDLAAQQLVGLYAVVQSDIAEKNYPKAITSLKAISSYVNSSDVAVLPGIATRRAVDLFIVNSLTALVEKEISTAAVDTGSLVEAANTIASVRALVEEADEMLRAGRLSEAETQYGKALAVIPEIARTYAWFTDTAKAAEEERRAALRAGLARAETAFAAGRHDEVLIAYKEALAYLPETSSRLASTLSMIGESAVALSNMKANAEQTNAAAAAADAGDSLMAKGQHADAIAQYLMVLKDFPLSSQTQRAVKGITDGVAAMSGKAAAELKSQVDQVAVLNAQLTDVRARLDASLAEILAVKTSLISLLGTKQDPASADSAALMKEVTQRYGDLKTATSASSNVKTSLDAAAKKNAELSAQINKLTADNARLNADLNTARQETDRQRRLAAQAVEDLQAAQATGAETPVGSGGTEGTSVAAAAAPAATPEAAPLSTAEQRRLEEFESLAAAYIAYARQEDENLSKHGQQKALMLSIGSRDGFLASLEKLFDGFLGRLKRYEAQSSADGIVTGRRAALDDVISLMTGLAKENTADARKSFLDKRLAAEKDPKMKNLLGSLKGIVTGQ